MTWTTATTANTITTGLIVRTAIETDTAEDHEIAHADPVKSIREDTEINQYHDRYRARKSATSVKNLAVGRLDIPTTIDVKYSRNFATSAKEYLIDNNQR